MWDCELKACLFFLTSFRKPYILKTNFSSLSHVSHLKKIYHFCFSGQTLLSDQTEEKQHKYNDRI